MARRTLLVLFLLALGAMETHGQSADSNLIENGDFEVPNAGTSYTTYREGTTFGAWTVEFGSVDHKGGYLAAARGAQSVDLSGSTSQAGAIYQDVETTPGQTYRLRFAIAGNPVGSPPVKRMEIWWDSKLVDDLSIDTTGRSTRDMNWGYVEYTVTASSTVSRVRFVSLTPGNDGPTLDDVQLFFVNTTATSPPAISSNGVVNAASFLPGPVAPGEMITIFGSNIGPSQLTPGQLSATGAVSTMLAETRALFDGIPAPLIYVGSTQVSASVPYGVSGKLSTQLEIEYRGIRSNPVSVQVNEAAPGLFTANSSGRGQAAALNENGSINSILRPAEPGSIVVLYGTGEGQTDPPGVDGRISTDPLPKPLHAPQVLIDGTVADILYAGAAPGQVAGVFQINVRVPVDISGGSVSVRVQFGSVSTQPATLAFAAEPANTTIVLVHGIRQEAADLDSLATKIRAALNDDPLTRNRFIVDAGFDYGYCAKALVGGFFSACSSDCSILDAASKLATYIAAQKPKGSIIILGYSMGGLIARQMMLDHRELIQDHPVSALITLGTPHLGYPYTDFDDSFACKPLLREMFGDLRNTSDRSPTCTGSSPMADCRDLTDKFGNEIALSSFLYDLNTRWSSVDFLSPPHTWMAASGAFCEDPTRRLTGFIDPGCADTQPRSDGVVCDQSARYLWAAPNGPTDRSFNDRTYAHVRDRATWGIFCRSNLDNLQALSDPGDELIHRIKQFIQQSRQYQ